MALTEYILHLRCNSREVATVTLAQGCSDVIVGRSHDCTLRTPAEDHMISSRHARLYWSGKSLLIEDAGSRNGIYSNNLRLNKPQKITGGEIFSLGGCTLVCERQGKKVKSAGEKSYHRLEFLNGDKAGRQIDICPKAGDDTFTIGLDPSNALHLPDMLVSRRHAYLETKENGECWLYDCGSRNGTYVNGEPLRGKERLLKDNDKISIAYFDLRFLDRNVSHTRLYLWVKIMAVALTLCVMAGFYVVWTTTSSTVEDHLRLAREYASVQNFEGAQEVLSQARLVRNAGDYRAQIDVLDDQLSRWAQTSSEWQKAMKSLKNGYFRQAQKILDPIVNGAVDAWTWNGVDAIEQKKRAEFAMLALRTYYDAQDALGEARDGVPEEQADRIFAAEKPFAEFINKTRDEFSAHEYLGVLSKNLEETLNKMSMIRKGFGSVDGAIAKLDAINPNFANLAVALDVISRDTTQHRAVRAYADKYKAPCLALAETKRFIGKEFDDINAMQFGDVRARDKKLVLPPAELCSRHPQLSNHREKLEGHHRDAQKLALNLESFVNGLSELGIENGKTGTPVKHILSVNSWKEVLSFSCFKSKPPTVRRKTPSSFYDELIGIDYTFYNLRALPKNYDGYCLRLIGFSPDCVEARTAFERVDVFVTFVENRPAWLRRGALGSFYSYCKKLLLTRDKLIGYLESYEGSKRAELIARFYAGYFSKSFNLEKQRALAESFRELQREIASLNEKYDASSNPMEQITIRAKILALGIPGDPQMHAKWVAIYEGGQ